MFWDKYEELLIKKKAALKLENAVSVIDGRIKELGEWHVLEMAVFIFSLMKWLVE